MRISLALALAVTAQFAFADGPHTVRASAQATVMAAPDRAEVSSTVIATAQTAEAAASADATRTAALLSSVRAAFPQVQVRTAGYNVVPQYRYEQGKNPELTGYQASNNVSFISRDVARAGKLIDAVAHAGADTISISFSLEDDSAVKLEALGHAAEKARQSAEAVAKALGLHVTGVLEAETAEAGSRRPGPQPMMRAMAAEAPTPMEAGPLTYTASVEVTLAVQ